MRRLAPRRLEAAVMRVTADLAPPTTLARTQGVWSDAVGPRVAAEAQPTSEREGVVTAGCRDGVWAQELELMSEELRTRLNDALERSGAPRAVTRLRFAVRR